MSPHIKFAQGIAADIWQHRHRVSNDYLDVNTTAAIAAEYADNKGPLVISDYADNPGAGAYGDATNLLQALLQAGVSNACFGPLVDAETVQQLMQHEPGDKALINLGGKTDPAYGGPPLALQAELVLLSDGGYIGGGAMIGGLTRSFGPTAVVRVSGMEILITSVAQQLLDQQQFRCFGIEPTAKSVVALKSMQHFRADFEPIAGRIIVCDSEALCSPSYERLEYHNVTRPIFPLDQDFEF